MEPWVSSLPFGIFLLAFHAIAAILWARDERSAMRARIMKEMTIAVGVAAGVATIVFIGLLAAGTILRAPAAFDNICTLDRVLIFERSAVGQSANAQLLQIKQRSQDEIDIEKQTIDQLGLGAGSADRMSELVKRVRTENGRLEAVRAHARALVIQKIAPEIRRQAVIFRCAAVLDRLAIVDQGQATDLTFVLIKSIAKNVPTLPSGTLQSWAAGGGPAP